MILKCVDCNGSYFSWLKKKKFGFKICDPKQQFFFINLLFEILKLKICLNSCCTLLMKYSLYYLYYFGYFGYLFNFGICDILFLFSF